MTANDAVIDGGRFDGQTLGEIIAMDPRGLLGPDGYQLSGGQAQFPLLIKLIDAAEDLSIQVHPSDALAPAGSLGKSEAWYVLAVDPGARLLAGLAQGADAGDVQAAIVDSRSLEPLVQAIAVVPGDVIYAPAGTIHALGAGITIYEIQQPSAITYRLYDWGRDREMHVDVGLAALDPASRPQPVDRATLSDRTLLSTPFFALDEIHLSPGTAEVLAPDGGPQVFTVIQGTCEISCGTKSIAVSLGGTGLVFARVGPVRLATLSGAIVLRGWLG